MVDQHPLLFPTVLRHVAPYEEGSRQRHNLQIREPMDDRHTQVFRVNFVPADGETSPPDRPVPWRFTALKTGPRAYKMNMVSAQDSMAWETQGALTDRTQERLGAGDEGIIDAEKTAARTDRNRPAGRRTHGIGPRPGEESHYRA